jgi:L-ribulose-5-phosphate 3-epimerase
MIDGEGRIGDRDPATRRQAAENHFKWVEAAKTLGCHAIRVNAFGGPGSFQEQLDYAADGYGRIVAFGAEHDMSVIIENHGGFSSDPSWLKALMERIDHPRAGLLPDFGNFSNNEADPPQHFDPYDAVRICMPFAKGVSVKDQARMPPTGERAQVDFERMMRIVLDSGWRGYAGVEYGGLAGIRGAREALEAVREQLSTEYA